MKKTAIYIAITLMCFALGFLAGRHRFAITSERTIARTDTLIIRDTVTESHPYPVDVVKTDTMRIALRDTVTLHDTAYIILPRTQAHYKGDDYECWVSGYEPRLDRIDVFPETKYITTENNVLRTSAKRCGIGVQVGYGFGVQNNRVQAFPYIGVGLSYNIVRF